MTDSSVKVPEEYQNDWIEGTSRQKSVCICLTGVDPVRADRLFKYLEYPDDPCLKCYLNCVHRNNDMMNSDGTFNIPRWIAVVKGINETIANNCSAEMQNETDLLQRGLETRELIASRYNLSEGEDEIKNCENSEFEETQNGLEIDCDEPTVSKDYKDVSREILLQVNVHLGTPPAGTDRRMVNNQFN
ncbi:hypothetical protein FQR65_LT07110 [Abscondita terminalis]|nr:hypothetical protein FQR65_LT07110 [Abscondita terminalis]